MRLVLPPLAREKLGVGHREQGGAVLGGGGVVGGSARGSVAARTAGPPEGGALRKAAEALRRSLKGCADEWRVSEGPGMKSERLTDFKSCQTPRGRSAARGCADAPRNSARMHRRMEGKRRVWY